MERYLVDSSFIEELGYDPEIKLAVMTAFWRRGGRRVSKEYPFPNFPQKKFEEWLLAESKGKFFNLEVKGKYGDLVTPAPVGIWRRILLKIKAVCLKIIQ